MFGKFNYVNHWNIYLNMLVYKSFKYVGNKSKKIKPKKIYMITIKFLKYSFTLIKKKD